MKLLKWLYTAFMIFYLPIFWLGYGPQNFLWLSSILLIITYTATLLESPFLASIAALSGLFYELLWILDFLYTLIALPAGLPLGFTAYVFDPNLSILLKALALYHLVLPPLLLFLIFRLGYDKRAWPYSLILLWSVFFASWLFTDPALNINLVFSYAEYNLPIAGLPFQLLLCLVSLCVVLGTHFVLRTLHKKSGC